MFNTRIFVLAAISIFISSCEDQSPKTVNENLKSDQYNELDRNFNKLVVENDVLTAGAAIIKNGELSWVGNFGDQAPGLKANIDTQYNVGSITKTVAAETILRLVAQEKMSLDEPMSPIWVDPDIEADFRHKSLTPRTALTHTTGFPNWRFFTQDGKLSFLSDPGASFTYSGEGFEYLATYAEKLTNQSFDSLVKTNVFEPIGITNAAYSIDPSNFENIAQTKNSEGSFPGHYCYPENGYCRQPGSSTPADDLVITVSDYAKFLISVMNSDGYENLITEDRNSVHTTKDPANVAFMCDDKNANDCPINQGYGLGWEILDFGDREIVFHGGSDWHELAITYFDTESKDGVIIFLNAPTMNTLKIMPEALSLLDENSPMIGLYQRWLQQAELSRD